MPLIGAGALLAGYTLVWRGMLLLSNCRHAFGDLLVPGRRPSCSSPDGTAGDKGASGFDPATAGAGRGAGGSGNGGGSW